jgi:hypothetical protein
MTVTIDKTEPNVFPVIEKIDARDSGHDAEVILATRIEGELTFVTVKLSYRQAGDLWTQLEPVSAQQARHNLAWPLISAPARPRNSNRRAVGR